MRHIISFIFIALACLSCSSDFLDLKPKGKYHSGNYDASAGQDLLILSKLVDGYNEFRNQTWPVTAMHCHTTDNSHPGGPAGDGGVDFNQFPTMSFTPANSHFTTYWTTNFTAITRANEALQMIADAEEIENPELYKAEAYFIRAAAYFRLTQAFGAVPYVDKVMDIEGEIADQLSSQEIRNKYIADLEWAIPHLPTRQEQVSTGNIGRATQNAARSILAKTFLYEKDWSSCLQYTGEIIESRDNDLSTAYGDIWLESTEFGPESVWEINADYKPTLNIDMWCQWNMMCGIRGTPNLGWGHNAPSQDLMDSYEKDDPRYNATVLKNGDIVDGEIIAGNNYEYYNRKCYCPKSERTAYGRDDSCFGYWANFRIIRYADIVLMHSEAACELAAVTADGDKKEEYIDEALEKLEMVRARARGDRSVLPEYKSRNTDALRDKIRQERRIELALEFERYFDLVRWGIAKDRIENFVEGKHELFPIPQSEIDKADGKLIQNSGY